MRKTGPRGRRALVAPGHRGPRPGLVAVLGRHHPEAERERVLAHQVLDRARALLGHELIVAGLAADDAAERDIAVEAAAQRREIERADGHLDRRGNLEHAGDRVSLVARAGLVAHAGRAAHQLVRDVVVEACLDDEHRRRISHVWLPLGPRIACVPTMLMP